MAVVAIALMTALAAIPAGAVADVVGIWWTPERDGKIEIMDSSGTVTGRLIAILRADADKRDDENPDVTLRDRRLLGLTILQGFKLDADGKWTGGTLYDPKSGQTYQGALWLDGADRMMMRGFVGISILGRTETLSRVDGPLPATEQPGEPDLVHMAR